MSSILTGVVASTGNTLRNPEKPVIPASRHNHNVAELRVRLSARAAVGGPAVAHVRQLALSATSAPFDMALSSGRPQSTCRASASEVRLLLVLPRTLRSATACIHRDVCQGGGPRFVIDFMVKIGNLLEPLPHGTGTGGCCRNKSVPLLEPLAVASLSTRFMAVMRTLASCLARLSQLRSAGARNAASRYTHVLATVARPLFNGERRPKDDVIFQALGDTD